MHIQQVDMVTYMIHINEFVSLREAIIIQSKNLLNDKWSALALSVNKKPIKLPKLA